MRSGCGKFFSGRGEILLPLARTQNDSEPRTFVRAADDRSYGLSAPHVRSSARSVMDPFSPIPPANLVDTLPGGAYSLAGCAARHV